MFKLFKAITQPIITTAGTLNQTATMGTNYVSNRAKRSKLVDREKVMLATAQDLADIKKELDADEPVHKIFKELAKTW